MFGFVVGFFPTDENTGDGELDLSGIDDNEIDRVRCPRIPALSAFGYLGKKNGSYLVSALPSIPLHSDL